MSLYSVIRKTSMKYSCLGILPGARYFYKRFDDLIAPRSPQWFRDIGGVVQVDHNDQSIGLPLLLNGSHEPGLCALIKRIIKPGMTCVDIGANIGYISILIGNGLHGYGQLVSFEPQKNNYDLLKRNIELNHLSGVVTIENKAVSHCNTRMLLRVSRSNSGLHSLVDTEINDCVETVEVVSLDSYFGGRSIDFIKVDVQGAEQFVINGAKNLLGGKFKPVVIMEFWPAGLERAKCDPFELLRDLHNYGYFIWVLNEDTGALESLSDNDIVANARDMNHTVKGLGYCTLYCSTINSN